MQYAQFVRSRAARWPTFGPPAYLLTPDREGPRASSSWPGARESRPCPHTFSTPPASVALLLRAPLRLWRQISSRPTSGSCSRSGPIGPARSPGARPPRYEGGVAEGAAQPPPVRPRPMATAALVLNANYPSALGNRRVVSRVTRANRHAACAVLWGLGLRDVGRAPRVRGPASAAGLVSVIKLGLMRGSSVVVLVRQLGRLLSWIVFACAVARSLMASRSNNRRVVRALWRACRPVDRCGRVRIVLIRSR